MFPKEMEDAETSSAGLVLKNSRILQELNFNDKKAYKIVGEKDVLVPSRATIIGGLASYTSIGRTKKKSKKTASLGGAISDFILKGSKCMLSGAYYFSFRNDYPWCLI